MGFPLSHDGMRLGDEDEEDQYGVGAYEDMMEKFFSKGREDEREEAEMDNVWDRQEVGYYAREHGDYGQDHEDQED